MRTPSRTIYVVLGKRLDNSGNAGPTLRGRMRFASEAFRKIGDSLVVLSGGSGESAAMRSLLQPPPSNVVEESISRTTIENALFTRLLVESSLVRNDRRPCLAEVRIVTSDFHVPRAVRTFEEVFRMRLDFKILASAFPDPFSSLPSSTVDAPPLCDVRIMALPDDVRLGDEELRKERAFEARALSTLDKDLESVFRKGVAQIVRPVEMSDD